MSSIRIVTLINYKCSFFEVKYLKIIALLHMRIKSQEPRTKRMMGAVAMAVAVAVRGMVWPKKNLDFKI